MSLFRNALSAPSANDAFKLRYPRYLKGAVLAALALTALFVWLWPGYEPKPYVLRRQETCTLILVDVEPVLPARWPPSARPVAPVWPEFEPAVDFDIRPRPVICWEYRRRPVRRPPYRGPWYQNYGIVRSALPQLMSSTNPVYPPIAQRLGIEGTVVVHVRIDHKGRVMRAEVARSVHPLLDHAALAAARSCRFLPGTQRHVPVRTWVAIPYRFKLR